MTISNLPHLSADIDSAGNLRLEEKKDWGKRWAGPSGGTLAGA
jgi:hypothetical protein